MGLLLWPGVSLHLHAQNNPFKIHDSIYVGYKELQKDVTSPETVKKAEALSAKARALGDKKGECVALTIPVLNAFYGHDSLRIIKGQRIFPVGEADVLRIKSTFAPWNLLNYFVPSFRMC